MKLVGVIEMTKGT